MAPILDQLRADFAGRLEVTFIDVWQTPDEARAYRVRLIPTQIFYAADGRELARHEGFISREEILAQWKTLGVELYGGRAPHRFRRARSPRTAALALPAAFVWGVLSVALSPCHLSSVPLVVAYMSGGEELPAGRRALWPRPRSRQGSSPASPSSVS